MGNDQRATLAREARDRIAVIRKVLERLPNSLTYETATTMRGPNNTNTVRSDRGTLLAQTPDHLMAQFVLDAPGNLRFLSGYVELLERQAVNSRKTHRKRDRLLDTLCGDLAAAEWHGVDSTDGQRRVRSAVAAARDRRD